MLQRVVEYVGCLKCGQQMPLTRAASLRARDPLGVLCCCLNCGNDWIHRVDITAEPEVESGSVTETLTAVVIAPGVEPTAVVAEFQDLELRIVPPAPHFLTTTEEVQLYAQMSNV